MTALFIASMIAIIIVVMFLICCLHISNEKEEQSYIGKHMNLMDLDDDNKDWNLEEELTYDDSFVKKEEK